MSNKVEARPTSRHAAIQNLPYETVALVLQGGGALGAYQAGVYEGLAEAGITPNWVAGISIGALNTAIIAGNAPENRVDRLRDFWNTICRPAYFEPTAEFIQGWVEQLGGEARKAFNAFEAWRALIEGQRDFFVPRLIPPWLAQGQRPDELSFYDTGKLKSTLERLADFDRINSGETRVSVGAVDVQNGNFAYFDNTRIRLCPEHFMASGALPPGFPAVEIEGRFYWDGGLVSNTPLSQVLSNHTRRDTLAFQVDLWSAKGELPGNLFDLQERQKDIQFSSRTRAVTEQMRHEQYYRRMLKEVLEHVPADILKSDPWCIKAAAEACCTRYNVIHMIYQDKEWDGLSKDYEFGPLTMRNHWESGLHDMRMTLEEHPDWLAPPQGEHTFVTHDLHHPEAKNNSEMKPPVNPEVAPTSAVPDAPKTKPPSGSDRH
jgi:NTE family protein